MAEKNIKKEDSKKDNINIFDEFNTDISEEERVLKKEKDRDIYYYFHFFGKFLQILFLILFIVILFLGIYIYIQKDEEKSSQTFLNPVCQVFLGEVPIPETDCSSISYANKHYNEELGNLEVNLSNKIIGILPIVYESINFLKTKEVSFLLDKTESRLDIIKILEKFNKLKNDFTGIEKKKLICENFDIDLEEKVFSVNCRAYSKGYESHIIGFSGEKNNGDVRGTSISVANSFLNYIDKNSTDFSFIERSKTFAGQGTSLDSGYTRETSFTLKLKIN